MSEATDQAFVGGMTSDEKTPSPDTFLESVNFELVSDQHNTYAFESVKGNRIIVRVTKNYRPIGFAIGTDKVVLYSAYIGSLVMQNGEYGIVTFSETPGFAASYNPIYNHQELKFSVQNMIGKEAYVYFENLRTEPSYWTDFVNPPRTLNHANSIFSTNIPSGSLVAGKSYMVLDLSGTGSFVNYNGVTYGPNQIAGTVFTASAGPNYTVSGSVRVIDYFPVQLLDWSPFLSVSVLRFKERVPGTLYSGCYQYYYQYADNEGFFSKWSPPSRVIHVHTPSLPGSWDGQYQSVQGHASSQISSLGNRIFLDKLDTKFPRIRIAAVFYTGVDISGAPMLVFDGPVPANGEFDHVGNEPLERLDVNDLADVSINIRRVKTITSVNEIAFSGNIEYEPDFNWDPSKGVSAKCIEYEVVGDTIPINNAVVPQGLVPNLNGMSMATWPSVDKTLGVRSRQWYRVRAIGPGGTVTYNGNVYNDGETFQGVDLIWSYTSANANLEAIIRVKKYGNAYPFVSPNPSCLDIPIVNDYYDSKGQACDHYLKSYWRSEKYRFGILVFGLSGNPFYVRWLSDKIIPDMWRHAGDIDPDTGNPIGFEMKLGTFHPDVNWTGLNIAWVLANQTEYLLRHIGIEFSGLDFQALANDLNTPLADLGKKFSGFAIVRCPRDKQVKAQGLLMPTILEADKWKVHPQGPIETANDHNSTSDPNSGRQANKYAWYSPDFLMRFTGFPGIAVGDRMRIVQYIYDDESPKVNATGYRYGSFGGTCQALAYYNKMYQAKTGTPANAWPLGTYFNGPGYNINNDNLVDTPKSTEVETGQSYQIDANYTFENSTTVNRGTGWFMDRCGPFHTNSTCVRTYVVHTSAWEGNIGQNGFGSYSTIYNNEKALVNLVTLKGDLYGGNSNAAKAKNLYITTGHFQAFDSAFLAYLAGNNGKADGVQVFGGDATVAIFDICRAINVGDGGGRDQSIASIFPCESNLNVTLREGNHVSMQTGGITVNNPENFVCNLAYSSEEGNIKYSALPDNYKPNSWFPYRVAYSAKKIPGEPRDSFRVYKSGDFKDVDGRNGQIFNIRSKMMRLFYWQEKAIGTIPINERAAAPSSLGKPLIIGEGGVAERYDERTNFYGNQHIHSLGEFEEGFTWVDFKRRAYCYMNVATELAEMSAIRGLMTEFHDMPPDLQNNDQPLALGGISTQYDPRFKRMLTTFKLRKPTIHPALFLFDSGIIIPVVFYEPVIQKTLIFDTVTKTFGGWLSSCPPLSFHFNQRYYTTNPTSVYPNLMTSTNYSPGNIVANEFGTYINILAYRSSPVYAVLIQPQNDPTHWLKVNEAEGIYQDYVNDIGLFFGLIADGIIKYAVTGKEAKNVEKIFDFHRFKASENFFEQLKASTDNGLLGTDNAIGGNPEYDYRNQGWSANIPLDNLTGEQIQDYKMIVELIQKNGVVDPAHPEYLFIRSTNKRIVLSSVITNWRKAY